MNSSKVTEPVQADFVEEFVDVDGIETHYWEVGTEGDRPLVMVHGGGSGADSWGNWKYAMPLLADCGFHVFAMDMVGFGQSATPDPGEFEYTNQARIDQVIGFLETMNLDGKASLIGNSMGGAASMGVAMQQSDVLDRLVLVGAAGHLTPDERPERSRQAIETLASFDGSREGMVDIVGVLSAADWYDVDAMVDHRLTNLGRDGIKEAFAATMKVARGGDMFYDDDEIAAIDVPTLIINGREDLVIPPVGAWGLFELIDNSSMHILPECGHWVMVDRVQWSVELVSDFFAYS